MLPAQRSRTFRIILNKYENKLKTSDLQFGFKKGVSTDSCSLVFKETIQYYTNEHSNVYSVLIDATKAFDRVNFCKLFSKLLDREMPKQVLMMLLNLYTNQIVRVSWNSSTSQEFGITNGVRQGACMSLILYNIYIWMTF